jgi:hypothetical protein
MWSSATLRSVLSAIFLLAFTIGASGQVNWVPTIISDPNPPTGNLAVAGGRLGDIDGDGASDFVIGDSGGTGQLLVFSGATRTVLRSIGNPSPPPPNSGDDFGEIIAVLGDVDFDGAPDILASDFFNETVNGNPGQGQVYLVSGATGSLLRTLDDPQPQISAAFGSGLASAGDLTGDGVPDILVGAYLQDSAQGSQQGDVFVFNGATGSLLLTLNNPDPPDIQTPFFGGGGLASAGDINGDTVPDIAVGAPGTNDHGRVFIFSGVNGVLLRTLDNPSPPMFFGDFGDAVASADVNGDQVPDLLVGAPTNDLDGQVFIFSGATGSLLRSIGNPVPQNNVGSLFGVTLDFMDDVSGDGIPDVVVGAPSVQVNGFTHGRVYVFNGATGGVLATIENPITPTVSSGFGIAVNAIGDVNSDGISDVVVGAGLLDVAFLFLSNRAPVCTSPVAVPTIVWPPNNQFQTIGIVGFTDPDGNPLTISATSIFQDEPVSGEPDAVLSPLAVRAERDSPGDGRVYHINFTVTDDKGGSCAGAVRVGVPHDQGNGSIPVDGGPQFNSVAP